MTERILRELDIDVLAKTIAKREQPVVLLTAPNFEDRSVAAAEWFRAKLGGRPDGIGVHVVWLQTEGIDDIFDRIKADNRDAVVKSFDLLGSRSIDMTRLDLPSTDARVVIDKTRALAARLGGRATLILDISSLPRTVVRHLLDGVVTDSTANAGQQPAGDPYFSRVVCVYTAAGDYPLGADADMIGGIEGYYTKRRLHDLIGSAGVLEAIVSMAGTAHDAAQTLDALWSHGTQAKTSVTATVFLNRENFVYSYQRLGHGTWALNSAARKGTELLYTFELRDVIRQIFRLTDRAIGRHTKYRSEGGEGMPTFLIGGFGPKPIGLASLLARMRYDRAISNQGYHSTSDVLQVTGWQYTTRYSHGVGPMKAFEVDVEELFRY